MTRALTWMGVLGIITFYVIACAPVSFSPNESPDEGFSNSCSQTADGCKFDYTVNIKGGKVDILFVNDNSASMSFEQRALANKFSGFVQLLDGKHVDYRIAMTTTDVHVSGDNNEARAVNGHGSLQNGNLISFGSGHTFLTPSVPDRVSRFNNTIIRPETLACEQFIANWVSQNGIGGTNSTSYQEQYKINCPSGDERGTYAANLAVKNNAGGFMRSDAYLAIIFVSDEDVRSGLYCGGPNNPSCTQTGYPIDSMDQPLSLFKTLESKGKEAVTEIHSVVVTENSCLSQQRSQTLGNPPVSQTTGLVSGSLGSLYLTFAQNSWGEAVSICMDNFTSSLETLANKISENKGEVIACDNPKNLQVTPIPADPSFSYTRDGRNIKYNKQMPVGSQVRFTYSCDYVL